MSKSRVLIACQVVLASALLSAAALSPSFVHGWSGSALTAETILKAAAFSAAALILGLFSVWLPRGDQADTTGPIALAAGLTLSPLFAVAAVALAQLISATMRGRGRLQWSTMEYLSRRVALVLLVAEATGPRLLLGVSGGRLIADVRAYWLVGATALAFTIVDLLLSQLHASLRFEVPYLPLLVGNLRLQGWMVAAEVSVSVLTVLVYPALGTWALLLAVGLLLVMRQSFALLLEVRASYTATVEVMARALEAYDPSRRGHAERVATLATEAGRMLGLQGSRLENLNYAALFHDVGRIGADDESDSAECKSSEVLASVGFLAGSLPILRILDAGLELEESPDEKDLVSAYVIAYLSAWDDDRRALTQGRSATVNAIGARLYSSERRLADRVLHRVEQRVRMATTLASESSPEPS